MINGVSLLLEIENWPFARGGGKMMGQMAKSPKSCEERCVDRLLSNLESPGEQRP